MRVTVTTTATTICAGTTGDSVNRVALLVTSPSDAAESVFLEIRNSTGTQNTAATVAAGYELVAGASIGVELLPGDVLTGIIATSDVELHVLRSG